MNSTARLSGIAALLALAVTAHSPARSQAKPDEHAGHHGGSATAGEAAELALGEVRRISKDTGKVTLRHGEIKSLDMPPMSMVFVVRDPAVLDTLKVGDKVRFAAEKTPDGTYVVTRIQPER